MMGSSTPAPAMTATQHCTNPSWCRWWAYWKLLYFLSPCSLYTNSIYIFIYITLKWVFSKFCNVVTSILNLNSTLIIEQIIVQQKLHLRVCREFVCSIFQIWNLIIVLLHIVLHRIIIITVCYISILRERHKCKIKKQYIEWQFLLKALLSSHISLQCKKQKTCKHIYFIYNAKSSIFDLKNKFWKIKAISNVHPRIKYFKSPLSFLLPLAYCQHSWIEVEEYTTSGCAPYTAGGFIDTCGRARLHGDTLQKSMRDLLSSQPVREEKWEGGKERERRGYGWKCETKQTERWMGKCIFWI